jgi:hypothetical protein
MKQLKRGIALFLVVMAAALPLTIAEALETYEKAGKIVEIRSDQITISGQLYRLRSSTKLVSADTSRRKLSDLRPGDKVFIKGILLNGTHYIDMLIYEIPDPS